MYLSEKNTNRLFQYLYPSLKDEQIFWLKQRNTCKNVGCLKKSYKQRIDQLRNIKSKSMQFHSRNYLYSILKSAYSQYESKDNINEILYSAILEGTRAEFLFTTYVSMGMGGAYCGAGAVKGYIYLRVNIEKNTIEMKQRMEANDCGHNVAFLSHIIKVDSHDISIITQFDDQENGLQEAFKIKVPYAKNLKYDFRNSFYKLNEFPQLYKSRN